MILHKKEIYDYNYFERGVEEGISLYENFRWLPEVSLPMANFLKQRYNRTKILDYGCAKGFLVYALRLLGIESYGFDTSEYAISNCKKEVKEYLFSDKKILECEWSYRPSISVIFIKDVLEHFQYELLDDELKWMKSFADRMFVAVPLGEDNRYRIPEYGFDKTHIIKENEEWWLTKFIAAGWKIDEFYYKLDCMKKNWHGHHDNGNAFIFLSKGD